MTTVVMDKKEEIVMKLVHYLVTKENYTPIVVNGAKNEVWLENQDGPYKIVRINSNYIHNKEQYNFDLFKIKNIVKQVKRKTFSFKMNVLNINLDVNDDLSLDKEKDIYSIKVNELDNVKQNDIFKEAFPSIETDLLEDTSGIDLIINVTNDINEKTSKENEKYQETFKPKKIIVTYALIAICTLMYILQLVFPELTYYGMTNGELVKEGEIYRLLTSAFLHASIIHLLCNMYSLYIMGTQLETYLGKIKFIIVYIISAISGSLLSGVLSQNYSIGASGAIFGLFGSILYFGYHYRLYLGSVVRNQIIPLIIFNLVLGFMISGVDNFAHIGGLVGGFLATIAVGVKNKSTKQEQINGIIVLILYFIFLGFMLYQK